VISTCGFRSPQRRNAERIDPVVGNSAIAVKCKILPRGESRVDLFAHCYAFSIGFINLASGARKPGDPERNISGWAPRVVNPWHGKAAPQ
jgi:hypothetical protein